MLPALFDLFLRRRNQNHSAPSLEIKAGPYRSLTPPEPIWQPSEFLTFLQRKSGGRTSPFFAPNHRSQLEFPIHHANSTIELILRHLRPKPLRDRERSVSLFNCHPERAFFALRFESLRPHARGSRRKESPKQFSKENKFCPLYQRIAIYLLPNP